VDLADEFYKGGGFPSSRRAVEDVRETLFGDEHMGNGPLLLVVQLGVRKVQLLV
jgi:hypothetical protein